jgi:hypothetical protein
MGTLTTGVIAMTGTVSFSEEQSTSKVAAICPSAAVAHLQATRVRDALHLSEQQVQVLTSGQSASPWTPASARIDGARPLPWSHARLGAMGAVAGGLFFVLLLSQEVAMVMRSPWLALGVLAVFGGIAGLLGSGLATLRADHDPYVAEVLDALHEGESAVVVRALSVDQRRRARAILEQAGSGTTATM